MELKKGLTLNQHHKVVVGFMGMCLEDAQAQLAHEGVKSSLKELDTLAREVVQESKDRGYYVLDTSAVPEEFIPPKIPAAAKQCWERVYRRYQTPFDMQELINYVETKDLREQGADSAQQFKVRKWREQEPVVVRLCRTPGCREQLVITCRMAVNAIRGNKLLGDSEKNIPPRPYEPSTLCETHNFERGTRRTAQRSDSLGGARPVVKAPQKPQTPRFTTKWGDALGSPELHELTRAQVEDLQEEGLQPQVELLASLREAEERFEAAKLKGAQFAPSAEDLVCQAEEKVEAGEQEEVE